LEFNEALRGNDLAREHDGREGAEDRGAMHGGFSLVVLPGGNFSVRICPIVTDGRCVSNPSRCQDAAPQRPGNRPNRYFVVPRVSPQRKSPAMSHDDVRTVPGARSAWA